MPDFYTLYLIVLLVSVCLCIIWAALAYRYPSLPGARYWLGGNAASMAGGLVLATQGNQGLFVQTVAGNAFVLLGFYLNLAGLRRFHGRRLPARLAALLLGASVLAMAATFHRWYGHNPLYLALQTIPLGMACALLLDRPRRRELGSAIAAVALAAAAVSHIAMSVANLAILTGVSPDLMLVGPAAVDLLILMFGTISWNFGFLISAIDRLQGQVERLASEDDLTGLANRRAFMRRLATDFAACAREGRPLSLMLIDLDRFKAVNDRYGHAAGDAALRKVAEVIGPFARRHDLLARLGGDEFCMLLPDTDAVAAQAIAARLLTAMRASPLRWQVATLELQLSIGVACTAAGQPASAEGLLEQADRALYRIKREGRGRHALFAGEASTA